MLSFVTFTTYMCAALVAVVPVLGASPTATSTDVSFFNPLGVIPRSSPNIRATLPQTNAERLRRGLPLVKPRLVNRRTLRSRSSPAPCVSYEGVIKVAYTKIDGGAAEGYIHSALNAFGEYGIRNELDGALHVKFCASLTTNEVFEITTLNGKIPSYPFLGVSTGFANSGDKDALGLGSANYLYLVGSSHSTEPSDGGNTYTAVTGIAAKSKSTIWQFDQITSQLTIVWENPDHSFPAITAAFAADQDALFVTGDLSKLNRLFLSTYGRVTFIFESSHPQER